MSPAETDVFRWVLDVEALWPAIDTTSKGPAATAKWAVEADSKLALSFLTPDEQNKVLRFYHIKDAKLSLGSSLLKRCAVAKTCRVPWPQIKISPDKNHKPCYVAAPDAMPGNLEFNVSHHGSLVALVGSADNRLRLGVDIVQMNFDKDVPAVRHKGWKEWVKTYEAVFSQREVQDILSWTPPDYLSTEEKVKAKIRHFYAHWCMKEAYVKMTGEALMAPWLQQMEFRNIRNPMPASQSSLSADGRANDGWGEIYTDVEIWHCGTKIRDVEMELQAFQDDYMIATAVSAPQPRLLPFQKLDIKHDVYPFSQTEI
ncbi:MAG: hypothetical protein LQ342_005439 [Letrouitia transgressa]|nr:MAG: hypothetical protein LQ342_005439 [Letrouitia transgressa]